jgi:hypothetical protein
MMKSKSKQKICCGGPPLQLSSIARTRAISFNSVNKCDISSTKNFWPDHDMNMGIHENSAEHKNLGGVKSSVISEICL